MWSMIREDTRTEIAREVVADAPKVGETAIFVEVLVP
jgi:hypothetical protein